MTGAFDLGLNPYGLTYTVGLQGRGTPYANPDPIGLPGFIAIVREHGLAVIELDHRWLTPLSAPELARLHGELHGLTPICSYWLAYQPGETLADAVRAASALGARIIRFHLTPVLEGGRASRADWPQLLAHARATLARESTRIADAGLVLAIENHQDLGSEELLEIVDTLGPHTGICFDTGNAFAIGEDPVAFARRAAHRICHVHLKDYVAQFTAEGYRLVRCAIGDGAVPFRELAAVLDRQPRLTASIEPGALEARHVRLFTAAWWTGYPPRQASELGTMLGRLRARALPDDVDYRTPWEKDAAAETLMAYERAQISRSIDNLRAMASNGK